MAEKKKVTASVEVVPDNPKNIHLSKAEFVKQENARREKIAKVKAYEKSLDEEKTTLEDDPEETVPEETGNAQEEDDKKERRGRKKNK